jgi:hypothetical protein
MKTLLRAAKILGWAAIFGLIALIISGDILLGIISYSLGHVPTIWIDGLIPAMLVMWLGLTLLCLLLYPTGKYPKFGSNKKPKEELQEEPILSGEKLKVYVFDFGETNIMTTDPKNIIGHIECDIESMMDDAELQYTISIKRMTPEEYAELPEWE